MVEYRKVAEQKAVELVRRVSDVSEVDLSDHEHCILCFNDKRQFALGKCNHKNVCHTCILRLRFIMKDKKCPICKTECEELLIAETSTLTFEDFSNPAFKKKLSVDPEDKNVYYESARVRTAGTQLRMTQCMIYQCNPGFQFHNVEALK
jgi:hypothetical protein